MKCPKCHTDNPDTSRFCGNCATSLTSAKAVAPSLTKTLQSPTYVVAPGTVIAGHYEVLEKLGQGGMGEVYRALDKNLGRQVAIKILPQEFSADPERLARFEREAKLLATLNHPNIAAVYGFEEAKGLRFLVLELVEGETLQTRLDKGTLPIDEALETCRQVAEGLEAAHERGVVHRDLKPGNIMITPEGKVKILDFGLAKAYGGETTRVDIEKSPTITARMTEPGVILGTAAYMSPEQARSRPVDKRTDIWSFGCVLFECLTGTRAFYGETVSDTLAHILKGDLDWSKLRSTTPIRLRTLLRHCLEKNPKERLRDIGDARIEISEVLANPQNEGVVLPKRRLAIAVGLIFVVTAIGISVLTWNLKKSPTQSVIRTTIEVPEGIQLTSEEQGVAHTELALSPDGKSIFFCAGSDGSPGKSILYKRPLEKMEAAPIPGTEGAREPFISPDGQWVGFWAEGKLKKVAATGNSIPTVMCDCPNRPLGASWSDDGRIAIGTGSLLGIQLLGGEGGELKSITTLDPKKEMAHVLPSFLPEGRAILFGVKNHSWGAQARVESLKFATGERKIVLEDAADARFSPTGHIVFIRASTLMAAPFNINKLELSGPAVPVAEGIMQALNAKSSFDNSGAGQYQFSNSGQLLYVQGGIFSDPQMHVDWIDQAGKIEAVSAFDRKPIASVRISPDGKSVVYRTYCRKAEIWVYDLNRGTSRLLTREGRAMHMGWTPDGKRITCAFSLAGVPNIYWLPADGSGAIEPLIQSEATLQPGSWSSGGRYLLYIEMRPGLNDNIWVFIKDEKKTAPLFTANYEINYPEFSPDGRYLAYCTDETGRVEVYVSSFPEPNRKTLVSTGGGIAPIWAPNGHRIYYWSLDWKKLMAVDVTLSPTLSVGTPRFLFEYPLISISYIRPYDISPDGTRFLVIREDETRPVKVTRLNLVQNWFEELKRLAPAGKK